MSNTHLGFILIGVSVLIAGLSIPLILSRVSMNHFYGVRFPQAFRSDTHWFRINKFGGGVLLLCSIPVLLVGVYGLFSSMESADYSLLSLCVSVGSVVTASIVSYLKARRIDRELTI